MSGYHRNRQPYTLIVTTHQPRTVRLVHSRTGERVPVSFLLSTNYGVYVTPEREAGLLFFWDAGTARRGVAGGMSFLRLRKLTAKTLDNFVYIVYYVDMEAPNKKAETETIRIGKMTREERLLMRFLSPEERKTFLLQKAQEKIQRIGQQ